MRLFKLLSIIFLFQSVCASYEDQEDNEFAEFEDFEESNINFLQDEIIHENPVENEENNKENELDDNMLIESENDDEALVEDSTLDFEHFIDSDEFEGFEEKETKPLSEAKITIAKIPLNLMLNWDSYYLEILMISGLAVYFLNYLLGKSKNLKIANTWFQVHKQLLEDNFAMVGDDGNKERNEDVTFVKDSENVFILWCSGRVCCEGMLVELRFIKRHDILGLIIELLKPSLDQIHITVRMNKEDMDSFIFAVATKKTASQMAKDLQDISIYCPERKPGEKFSIPANFQVMAEMGEISAAIMDSKITAVLNKYAEYIDYIHFSDQFSGAKLVDETNNNNNNNNNNKLPEVDKVLRFGFNLPKNKNSESLEDSIQRLKPLMIMVLYCIDKIKRYRLSKEGKAKADKNRQKVEEAFLKSTHHARAEAAAARREEKKRQEKERVMAEEDPEKQRRWEMREEKRQAKKRTPRMKQLKVKAL